MTTIYDNYEAALEAAINFFKENKAKAILAGYEEYVEQMVDEHNHIMGDYGFVAVVLSGDIDMFGPEAGPNEHFYYEL